MNVNNTYPAEAIGLRGLDVEGVSGFVLAGVQRGLELLTEERDLPALFAPFDVLKGKEVEVTFKGEGQTRYSSRGWTKRDVCGSRP